MAITVDLGTYDQRVLDGTTETVYTVATGHTFIPKTISFVNVSASDIATVSLWIVANGGTAENKNKLIASKEIIGNETLFINPDIYMQAGYMMQVKASAASVIAFQLSGTDMHS
jgi:hypothetical protein